MKYKCTVCGHIYDEEKAGVKFADLPDDWKCPLCKQPKSKFEPVNETAELSWASEEMALMRARRFPLWRRSWTCWIPLV